MPGIGIAIGLGFGRGYSVLSAPSQVNMLQWLKGGTLDGVTLVDAIGTLDPPELRDVSCVSFGGGNPGDGIKIESSLLPATDDFDLSFIFLTTDASLNQNLVGSLFGVTTGRWIVGISASNVRLFVGGTPIGNFILQGGTVVDDTEHTLRLTRVGDLFTLYLDGISVDSDTNTVALSTIYPTLIGMYINAGSIGLTGKMGSIYLDGEAYPFQETDGAVVYDVRGSYKHGRKIPHEGELDATGLARMNAGTLEGQSSHNAKSGFTISTLSVYDNYLIALDMEGSENGYIFVTDTYTTAAAAAHASLITKGWTITDGGLA